VLERVDQILLLEDGEIIARGHHRELLLSSADYRDTWSLLQSEQRQPHSEENTAREPENDS
jgi:ABC-type multidrug transport system fused ATPase/permease subunit